LIMTMTSNQSTAWRERAELAERENERLHEVVEALRAQVPQSMSRALIEPMRDLTPAEMLRLAADMFDARQWAQAKAIVDHQARELRLWSEGLT